VQLANGRRHPAGGVDALEQLRGTIPDAAKDIRLNLQAVLRGDALTEAQRWGADHVNDAVRIAATIYAAAVALEAGAEAPALEVATPSVYSRPLSAGGGRESRPARDAGRAPLHRSRGGPG